MNLICNELSFVPLAASDSIIENRFTQFLKTFQAAQKRYGFKKILFLEDIAQQQVSEDSTFSQCIAKIKNSTVRNALLSFYSKPFLDDLSDAEAEDFYKGTYTIEGEDCPNSNEPYGVPLAYIRKTPCISINSAPFWQQPKLSLLRAATNDHPAHSFMVYNLCLEASVDAPVLKEWLSTILADNIDSETKLSSYLDYHSYQVVFEPRFFKELMNWKEEDDRLYKRILALMRDVELYPFTGGKGKTEKLKNDARASKRITQEHRLTYVLAEDCLTFCTCKRHYEDK